MAFILYFLAVITGLARTRSKAVTAYIYAVMLLLAAFRTSDSDLYSYIYEYSHAFDEFNSSGRYIGYKYLIQFFNRTGMSFESFLFVFYAVLFLILIYGIRLLTEKINAVLSLYLITFFGIDVIQMKSFIAGIFAFLGIAFLLCVRDTVSKRKKRVYTAAFIVMEAAGMLMHFSYLFFLAAGLMVLLFQYRNCMKYWIYAGLMAAVLLVYSGITGVILSGAIKIGIIGSYDAAYMERFFSVQTRFGAFIPALWAFLLVYFMFHSKNRQAEYGRLDSAMNVFTLTCLVLIPFFFVYVYFSRLLRPYMLIAYIALAERKLDRGISFLTTKSSIAFMGALAAGYCLDVIPTFWGTLGSLLTSNSLL